MHEDNYGMTENLDRLTQIKMSFDNNNTEGGILN